MSITKIIYWVSTILLCLLFMMGAIMYIFNYPRAEVFFINLGFPTWIIYPLAALKIIAPIIILTRVSLFLKELAYAGFLFDAILAFFAHLMVLDGEYLFSVLATILTIVSWIWDRKVYGVYKQEKVL